MQQVANCFPSFHTLSAVKSCFIPTHLPKRLKSTLMLKISLPWVTQLSYQTGNKSSKNANLAARRSFHFFAHFLPHNYRLRQAKTWFSTCSLFLYLRAFFVSLLLLFLFFFEVEEKKHNNRQSSSNFNWTFTVECSFFLLLLLWIFFLLFFFHYCSLQSI